MEKILIANRGEIARRIIRTCREMGRSTVAVFSEPDRDSLFVADADEAAALGGRTPAESYLRADAIVEAARRTGADAVHPGYGFLAENAEFAAACNEAGLCFIGPSPEAIATMGSKIEAKRRMQEADVPVLPSFTVADEPVDTLVGEAEKMGWPVLVKASAGGGGRGMRIVGSADELAGALDAARQEAQSAFGDGTVFLEPYVEAPRHVEIQIFGDAHGKVVHLFERECSIQRRHQKIVEEAPSPALDEELRAAMGDAAVKAGQAIGYTNAGTVEFLLTPERKFYFLEVNTRLQVEHPVTECITGLDLVRLQLEIAQGAALPAELDNLSINGHAIEVRLYAEDPTHDYRPATGTLHRFAFECAAGIRVETGVSDGAEVSPYYDPMLAKVIAHAPTRGEAAARLAAALARAEIHGPRTNRELLVRILRHEEFLAGNTDTHFLDRFPAAELGRSLADDDALKLHAAAAALVGQAARRAKTKSLHTIPSGWRNNPSQLQQISFQVAGGDREVRVGYALRRRDVQIEIDDEPLDSPRLGRCTADEVELETGSVLRRYRIQRVGARHFVDGAGSSSELVEVDRYPAPVDQSAGGSLVAPLPGLITEIRVSVGDEVESGQVLAVIESMKMLHDVNAPIAGRVAEIRVAAESHVEAGGVIAVIEQLEPAAN